MLIFNKKNGTLVQSSIPFKNLKKFLDMSKITTNKTVLQRNGKKNSHALNNKLVTEFYKRLG
jgi:hypothetical protein